MHKSRYVKPVGLASVAGVAIFGVLTVTILSNTPQARAESLTDKGISSLRRLDSNALSTLTTQFSTDPVTALKEAKNAEDLKIISKSEYEQLKRSARSVETSSKVTELPGGGYEISGSVSGNNIAPGGSSVGSSPEASTPVAGLSPGAYQDGEPVSGSDAVGGGTASSPTGVSKAAQDHQARELQAELDKSQARAAKFVSYTNASGQTVAIAFDGNDTPLFRSVFVK